MRADLPSGTVTFLFTDVEGSTALLHALGAERYAASLETHRRVVRSATADHSGVEVDTQGDAFFVAFATPADAIAAAEEVLRELDSGQIRVRMGIHTGQPLLTSDGYVGSDVHLAARIAAAGHGGQVLLSRATLDMVGIEATELGEHRLKDFSEPVRIYQLGRASFPPLKTISNTNLPRPARPLVGRVAELAEVLGLFRGGARFVTLTGPGGTGKSRLAVEVAAAMVPDCRAGVFWVSLADLRDPGVVLESIARVLGARGTLADYVHDRELMLVLDNFEQVVEAGSALASLVASCPNLRVLVTSREVLRVAGEWEYPVPPLDDSASVELFRSRSGLSSDPAIPELCRRLDNLPLALELAAARTSILSPAQIVARLSQRLDLFSGGRDAGARQQTLRATISWSYDLLTAGEQELFARFAVFSGGCSLEAAEEVTGAGLDRLQGLVDKSLIRHGAERFVMLETIRQFAEEQLGARPDSEQTREAHAAWYRALAGHADLRGPDYSTWLARLRMEHANFRTALEWLKRAGREEAQLEMASDLGEYAHLTGAVVEGRRWLEEALANRGEWSESLHARALAFLAMHAAMQGDLGSANRIAEEGLRTARGSTDPVALGEALRALALVRIFFGQGDEAERLSNEALDLARTWQLGALHVDLANNLGYLAIGAGDLVRAEALLQESLDVARAVGDTIGSSWALGNLGLIAFERLEFEAAARLWAEALEIAQRDDLPSTMYNPLVGAAALMARDGDFELSSRLVGLVDELADRTAEPLQPFEQGIRERTITTDIDGIGAEAVEAAMVTGREADPQRVVREALEALASGWGQATR